MCSTKKKKKKKNVLMRCALLLSLSSQKAADLGIVNSLALTSSGLQISKCLSLVVMGTEEEDNRIEI
ncbi:hypothetical protein VNO78_13617 [Psophocarpus tetragonolobus]|uniref:Uncharacterized protein n=1 Tax=Psophocarpus tetragonolobus TaxID=3891 RepID=A0AAN9SQJ2_PSOTE